MVSLDAYAAPGRLVRTDEEFQEVKRRLGGIVRSVNAELGLWIDPGGEVIHLVDDAGRSLTPELAQSLFVRLALQHLGVKTVAIPVTSPSAVVQIIRDAGAELIWTKTEHHAMMCSATEADMVAGTRGEFIFSHFMPAYDGMFSAVKFLEGLARAQTPLREMADAIPAIHVAQERIACPWGKRGAVMRRLLEATENDQRDLVDGVKTWKDANDWMLIIPHSHRPYFVVTVEGPDDAAAAANLDRCSRMVERWRDEA
jgi:mannose-1-phosphate guanylyltransferase/phosphomannomutase